MKLKEDFLRLIRDSISQYPDAALLYQVSDPRLLASLEAIATQFAMLSQQLEQNAAEPYIKSRDATVLADAALKGILPMARPARDRVSIQNPTADPYLVPAGRRILDANGRLYVVESAVTVAAGATGYTTAVQSAPRVVDVTVASSDPFYAIEVPPSPEDKFIAGISVTRVSDGEVFAYRPAFCNVQPGELVYHVETDEYRRLYVKFGYQDVVGYQPGIGEVFRLAISECNGDVRPEQGSPFSLEYTLSAQDTQVIIKADTLLEIGSEPMDMATLRELTRYPSAYDDNAVFLGNFDFLVRRRLPQLRFLSIWNEQVEERVRGASIDSVNKLFIAVLPQVGADLAATRALIEQTIAGADDSYRFGHVAVADSQIPVTIEAYVGIQNDPAVVESQIRQSVLREYGEDTPAAKRGQVQTQHKRFYDRLRKEVPALTDQGSDFSVVIGAAPSTILPEQRRYVSNAGLTVTVHTVAQSPSSWGI